MLRYRVGSSSIGGALGAVRGCDDCPPVVVDQRYKCILSGGCGAGGFSSWLDEATATASSGHPGRVPRWTSGSNEKASLCDERIGFEVGGVGPVVDALEGVVVATGIAVAEAFVVDDEGGGGGGGATPGRGGGEGRMLDTDDVLEALEIGALARWVEGGPGGGGGAGRLEVVEEGDGGSCTAVPAVALGVGILR